MCSSQRCRILHDMPRIKTARSSKCGPPDRCHAKTVRLLIANHIVNLSFSDVILWILKHSAAFLEQTN